MLGCMTSTLHVMCSVFAEVQHPHESTSDCVTMWLQALGGTPRPVRLVDVPGHPRVRGTVERYAPQAAGVVFLVDSVDFMPRKTEAAE
jgi:signal recognition particle receptor subunit beta